jgi:hypothetical protein
LATSQRSDALDREGVKGAVLALEDRAGAQEAALGQTRRTPARARGPAGMHALGPGALRQVLDDARGHGADDAKSRSGLFGRQPQSRRHARRRAECAADRRGVEALPMHGGRGHQRQAADQLGAHRKAAQHLGAGESALLRGGQERRDDHRADVDRRPLEGVVVVFAMDRCSVHKAGGGQVVAARMADQRAGPIAVGGEDGGLHVVLVPRGQHEPKGIQQGALERGAHGRGDFLRRQSGGPVREGLCGVGLAHGR